MKKIAVGLVTLSLIMSAPSYALFGLGEKDSDSVSKLSSQISDSAQNSSELVNSLKDQLGVSSTQAAGGAGALLALASNKLPATSGAELDGLSSQLGGLLNTAKSASSSLDSMAAVKSAFEKLGLDSAMVDQYAPIVLEYLNKEGASSGLMDSLTSLWK
ncbi:MULTISPECIES: DUF2780 domain-containing protein [Vibrio]|uniref:DUF2780 domain-containing protein n=1 Tax=Vibrio algicola TaxID=2662262 RepID=A0A5Q0TF12_9VIBR|nr:MULTISPECIES: DUF2780 domain-containing protein [Vibrio]MBD1576352.1 DUF2780 domain-containing protein [Vibrio sp. S11_S32]